MLQAVSIVLVDGWDAPEKTLTLSGSYVICRQARQRAASHHPK